MLENLFNDILSNPAYLAVAIALAAMIAYSVIKRLYKLVVLAVVLFVIYCAYLTLTDQPLPEIDIDKIQEELGEVTDQAKELKEKASDTLDKANDTLDKLKN
ncbi:MAG: hypothetical protein Ct9H300mP18_01840 [Candidatus Neomarinimicrobiota bacterium]|jgi:hypothetical protein|nr:hypothetical protein [Candidatus Neomarinimicrobiota bacterium]MEE3241917.1 hypothetical protein [Candidatus Neomarinimicrobiota bacterium]GIT10417.1 MAG: hypothetical protein CM1200mP31_5860 [Candidatus Neomarinimicrobiota bacterium]GIT56755.1 MAG: hypothetical protein Ct9H300mP18_01840 [Candidatus Neomarinimicrobiota bacterium]|tara:strand:- start:282 stop:587 length:306 start_codon:yes stop_codon:yes gene_type:complete